MLSISFSQEFLAVVSMHTNTIIAGNIRVLPEVGSLCKSSLLGLCCLVFTL